MLEAYVEGGESAVCADADAGVKEQELQDMLFWYEDERERKRSSLATTGLWCGVAVEMGIPVGGIFAWCGGCGSRCVQR